MDPLDVVEGAAGAVVPGIRWAKWIGIGFAVLALLGLVAFAVLTVKGWRDDAAMLPVVQAQLKSSQDAYVALDKRETARLASIATKLDANAQRLGQFDGQLTSNQNGIAADVQDFLRRYSNAPQNHACDEPQPVRDGLLGLFPLYAPAQRPAGGGGGQGGSQAGSPAATSAPAAMPGRQQPAGDQGGVGVPAAAGRAASAVDRDAAGTAGGADRRAEGGDRQAVPVEGMGMAPTGWFARCRDRVAAALKLIGTALVETAQDDKGDA